MVSHANKSIQWIALQKKGSENCVVNYIEYCSYFRSLHIRHVIRINICNFLFFLIAYIADTAIEQINQCLQEIDNNTADKEHAFNASTFQGKSLNLSCSM
jgi:hypothetical protein